MKVSDWIEQHPKLPITVPPESPIGEIVDQMLSTSCLRDIYVASAEGVLIGHISHRLLSQLLLAEHRPTDTRRQLIERVVSGSAKEIMDFHFTTAQPDEELDEVLHRLLESEIEDMPVTDTEGIPIGAINLTEVLHIVRGDSLNKIEPSTSD